MRSKLVLLLAAAVVFAPGGNAGEGFSHSKTPSELAGRVLAPTFTAANTERVWKPVVTRELVSPKARSDSNRDLVGMMDGARINGPAALLLAAVGAAIALAARRLRDCRAKRAPPVLTV